MPLTPQEVASKVFGPTRMRRGYDENEVDAFLDQVEAELTRLTAENDRLRQENEQLRAGGAAPVPAGAPTVEMSKPDAEPVKAEQVAEPEPEPVVAAAPPAPVAEPEPVAAVAPVAAAAPPDDTAMEQRVARMLVLAQQTADAAVHEAQVDADRTRGNARVEAERLLSEARSRAAEEIGQLERSKAGLESQIEHLQTFESEYRTRLRAYLEMQLHDLESGKAGIPAVEGRQQGELGASSQPGPSDPPGFGQVWAPEGTGNSSGDPLVTTPAEPESHGGASPFDTGSEGHHDGG
jgi:DivIVA domain-containing protein